MKSLWDTAVNKIKATLQEQLAFINETVLLQQVKNFIFLFGKTMQKYEYDTSSLSDFLHIICDKYFELATEENRLAFVEVRPLLFSIPEMTCGMRQVLDNDNFHPITVRNEEEFDFLIADNYLDKLFPLKSYVSLKCASSRIDLISLSLPQEFPFSSLVPQFLSIVRHFVRKYYNFALNLSNVDETVKRVYCSINRVIAKCSFSLIQDTDSLLRTLTQQMNNILRDPSKGNVYVIVQITLNLPILKRACPFIEEYLASFRLVTSEDIGWL